MPNLGDALRGLKGEKVSNRFNKKGDFSQRLSAKRGGERSAASWATDRHVHRLREGIAAGRIGEGQMGLGPAVALDLM